MGFDPFFIAPCGDIMLCKGTKEDIGNFNRQT